mmetsp:Transcript_1536/g.2879  ORF Transcript_1536/g.2879 Transcript_1536/m.2879 type:complete len:654 (+) Transcript_1536:23-1984(+)
MGRKKRRGIDNTDNDQDGSDQRDAPTPYNISEAVSNLAPQSEVPTAGASAKKGRRRNTTSACIGDEIFCRKSGNGHPRQNDQDKNNDASEVRSNWFSEVKWISRHEPPDHPDSSFRYGNSSNPKNEFHKPRSQRRSDLQSLLQELNSVKERLRPAAEACADVINDSNETHGIRHRTTPEYEFRKARSMCNPYESLGETYSKNYNRGYGRYRKNRGGKFSKTTSSATATSGFSQFVNRSAIKLANLDALLGFCLTSTRMHDYSWDASMSHHTQGEKMQQSNEHDESYPQHHVRKYFAFVDLCGAPGGFSEYILYRHVHPVDYKGRDCSSNNKNNGTENVLDCYGFGMSLTGKNTDGKGIPWDLKHLEKHHLGDKPKSFTLSNAEESDFNHHQILKVSRYSKANHKLFYWVSKGADGTGCIYNWDNVVQLQKEVAATLPKSQHCSNNANFEAQKTGESSSESKSNQTLSLTSSGTVQLVVADGGFDAQRDSNNQEIKAHQIIVSQTAAALSLLCRGGAFVIKMFGFCEEMTRKLLRYLYGRFDSIAAVKPILSRPASAERYLVCRGYEGHCEEAWNEKVLINAITTTITVENQILEEYFDQFDLDMMKLNLGSCRDIVQFINEKKRSIEQDDLLTLRRRRNDVHRSLYESAWEIK